MVGLTVSESLRVWSKLEAHSKSPQKLSNRGNSDLVTLTSCTMEHCQSIFIFIKKTCTSSHQNFYYPCMALLKNSIKAFFLICLRAFWWNRREGVQILKKPNFIITIRYEILTFSWAWVGPFFKEGGGGPENFCQKLKFKVFFQLRWPPTSP